MPTRIHIIHRIIRTIHIQMSSLRVHYLATITILCHKPTIFRIIIPCIQIVQPRTLIINSASITYFIFRLIITLDCCLSKIRILVCCISTSIFFYKTACTFLDIFVVKIILCCILLKSFCCEDISIGSNQIL